MNGVDQVHDVCPEHPVAEPVVELVQVTVTTPTLSVADPPRMTVGCDVVKLDALVGAVIATVGFWASVEVPATKVMFCKSPSNSK